jgi:2-methylcitrate dehydratase PrpD
VTDGLGLRWKISENCYKLHACCGHTHTAIDCALALRPGAGLPLGIEIETYAQGYQIVGNATPRTPYQAKFSIAYCTAVALLDGVVGLDQFAAGRLADPALTALLDRATVSVADDLTARYPAAWPCRLTLTLGDGRVLRGAADYPRGNPENPVSTAELEDKFRLLVEPRFGAATTARALETIRSLETCPDLAGVFVP